MRTQFPPTRHPPRDFRDRRTGLIVFGILTVCLGGLCALVVPLMLFGQAWPAPRQGGTAAGGTPSMLQSASRRARRGSGVVGDRLLLTRRWARALILIFGWSFLVVGVISMIAVGLLLPGSSDPASPAGPRRCPAGAETTVMVIILPVSRIPLRPDSRYLGRLLQEPKREGDV